MKPLQSLFALSGGAFLALALSCTQCKVIRSEQAPRESSFSALVASSEPIQWEVVNRFRLLKEDGATEQLFDQVFDYADAALREPDDRRQFVTHWQPAQNDYDDGYLKVDGFDIRFRAPFAGQCEWTVADHPTESNLRSFEKPCDGFVASCSIAGCVVSVRSAGSPVAATDVVRATILPRHVVIATLGDSYASGEGVPDLRGTRFFKQPRWTDRRCHRSVYSAHGLAALMYAVVNPHVAVSHLSYACSGALLTKGLTQPYEGIDPADAKNPVPKQVDMLRGRLNGATADYLTFSFGGNDAGFSDIVKAAAMKSDSDFMAIVGKKVDEGLQKGRAARDEFVKSLQGRAPLAKKVIVVGYPDPTVQLGVEDHLQDTTQQVNKCAGRSPGYLQFLPSLLLPFLHPMNSVKIGALEERVARPLQEFTAETAPMLGADYVGNLNGVFKTHGYCGPGLTPNNGGRWINTVYDSWKTQGVFREFGAMHPNIRGQLAIGKAILEKIVARECELVGSADALYPALCLDRSWAELLP